MQQLQTVTLEKKLVNSLKLRHSWYGGVVITDEECCAELVLVTQTQCEAINLVYPSLKTKRKISGHQRLMEHPSNLPKFAIDTANQNTATSETELRKHITSDVVQCCVDTSDPLGKT